MNTPSHLKYSREHEWMALDDTVATVGITDHAQDQLGDVVYLELPEKGTRVEKDQPFGVVESTKAVSDLFAPVTGTVTDVNTALVEEPAPINEDPYQGGWLLKLEVEKMDEVDELMNDDQYRTFCDSEG